MAKNEAAEPEIEQADGDAPLIDQHEAAIKKLKARAKKRGFVTVDEINEALPQEHMSSEQIEDVMSEISEMGVNIVENEDAGDDEDEKEAEPEDEVDPLDDGGPRPAAATKKEPTDRTDDPVRMYLREMGAVELLSREGEIAIAKRIEAGRDTMIWGLCESPITFNAIIEWSTNLNAGTMQLRRVMDLEAMLSKGPTAEQIAASEDDSGGEEISDFCLNTADEVASALDVDTPTGVSTPNPGFGGGCIYSTPSEVLVYSISFVPAGAGGVDLIETGLQTPGAVEVEGIGERAVLMSAAGPLVYRKGAWFVSTGPGLNMLDNDPAAVRTALETLARAQVDRF